MNNVESIASDLAINAVVHLRDQIDLVALTPHSIASRVESLIF